MIIGADSNGTAGANPFWTFSLALYRQPGIDRACLALQDEHNLDVNLLLYACFAASRGEVLEDHAVAGLDAAVSAWREAVLRPLRDLRRLAGDQFGEQGVRQSLLEAELAAERAQQDRIWAALSPAQRAGQDSAECLRLNLERVALFSGVEPRELESFLALVRDALPRLVPQH
jgi:uncharacterized protein (TIGR02444 family)